MRIIHNNRYRICNEVNREHGVESDVRDSNLDIWYKQKISIRILINSDSLLTQLYNDINR
jgi:hypothetical protein